MSKDLVTKNDQELSDVPEQVIELQKACGELNAMHKAALNAAFPGSYAEAGGKLIKHLKAEYDQVLNQFNNHPYVLDARAKAEEMSKGNSK